MKKASFHIKLRKGDEVQIMVGKDKGKQAKIEKIFPKDDTVLLPGLNMFKRHMKKRNDRQPSGILDLPRPVRVSNVALICPSCKKPTRIGYKVSGDEKTRVCKKCKNTI